MEIIAGDLDGGELYISDLDALLVFSRIDFSTDFESFAGCGCSDQVDDDLVAHQGLTTPIQADERKQAMLNLIPLGSAWWKVAYPDGQVQFIGQPLQLVASGIYLTHYQRNIFDPPGLLW